MKNIYQHIKNNISFQKVFEDICPVEIIYNNYKCPFCDKSSSFLIINDQYGKCFYDKCDWKGDIIQLYCDYKRRSLKEVVELLNDSYNLGLDTNVKFKDKLLTERGKYLKRLSDIKFIRQFRVMMSLLNYSVNHLSEKLNVNRKYISLILNERIDHKDFSERRYNVIIKLMVQFYKDNNDIMLNYMDLYFNDDTLDMVKKVNFYINEIY